MDLHYNSVVLFVKNIETSKGFYAEVLGQEIEYDFGKNVGLKSGISLWEIIEDHVISSSGKHGNTGDTKASELYFETKDMDHIQLDIAHHKLILLHDLLEEPWGQRTIRFYDPDNNLIEVGESMETFVRRLHGSGLSIEEVTARTTIPAEIIKQILNSK